MIVAFKFRLKAMLDAAVPGLGSDISRSIYHYWYEATMKKDTTLSPHFVADTKYMESVAGYIIVLTVRHNAPVISDLTEYGEGLYNGYSSNRIFDESEFEDKFFPDNDEHESGIENEVEEIE